MNELFRFLLIHPADVVASEETKQLAASFAPPGTPRDLARREAQAFIDSKSNATFADRLEYGAAALGLGRLGFRRLGAIPPRIMAAVPLHDFQALLQQLGAPVPRLDVVGDALPVSNPSDW